MIHDASQWFAALHLDQSPAIGSLQLACSTCETDLCLPPSMHETINQFLNQTIFPLLYLCTHGVPAPNGYPYIND